MIVAHHVQIACEDERERLDLLACEGRDVQVHYAAGEAPMLFQGRVGKAFNSYFFNERGAARASVTFVFDTTFGVVGDEAEVELAKNRRRAWRKV